MKFNFIIIISIILFTLLIPFVILQIYISMSINKTETQAYEVIRDEKDFEIRYYPSATLAMIASNATSYRDLGYSGFSKLAKYIFGGNSEKKQIAMTSPVHMDIGDSSSTMSFVMPSNYHHSNLPTPNNSEIQIKTALPEYVAAIQFGGFASNSRINKYKAILEKSLKEKGLTYYGNFRFLGYNPPFQLFGRRNEVIVALNESEIKINQ